MSNLPESQRPPYASAAETARRNEPTYERGAFMSVVHKDRSVEGYVIAETDLETVYHSSWLVEFGLLVATSCLGFAIGLYKDIILTVDAPEEAVREASLIYWVCGLCGSAGVVLATWQIVRRHRKVNEIKGVRSWFARLKVRQWISGKLLTAD